ncbi:MAG TPA: 4-alpha-glucanotransferase [Trichormus sp.]|jgi:4-alpha-glucanotransferase
MRIDTTRKLAGILVPVFALRHAHDFGVGDAQAMRDAIDFCAENNIGVLQILPINETGGDNSPYNAISSVALDPVYVTLTPDTVPNLTQQMITNVAPEALLVELRQGAVNYPRVKQLKVQLLWEAFNSFEKEHINKVSERAQELKDFESENSRWLEPYSLYRTLIDEHGGNAVWTQWEVHLHGYESAKASVAAQSNVREMQRSRQFWSFVQWVLFRQWREVKAYAEQRKVKLMGDLPFGVSRYSVDVWCEPELFDLQWSCGAPPEKFFQGDKFVREWGQNWGMPLYDWDAHRKENFEWWRQRVHHLTDLFHYFRIDHVLGFFRVYGFPWIPERNHEFVDLTQEQAAELTGGELPHFIPRSDEEEEDAQENAKEGAELLKVLLDASGPAGIVAEDLGMVPDYVRPLIRKLGMAGFSIPIFERISDEDREFKPIETLPVLSLATYGTHDHQPIAAYYAELVKWWHGPDGNEGWHEVQRLMRFLGEDDQNPPLEFTDELHRVFLRVLLETPCWLAALMITDMLGTTQRFNEPGLSGDYNWSQRLDRPLHQYLNDPQYGGKIKYLSNLIKQTDRAPLVSAKA